MPAAQTCYGAIIQRMIAWNEVVHPVCTLVTTGNWGWEPSKSPMLMRNVSLLLNRLVSGSCGDGIERFLLTIEPLWYRIEAAEKRV